MKRVALPVIAVAVLVGGYLLLRRGSAHDRHKGAKAGAHMRSDSYGSVGVEHQRPAATRLQQDRRQLRALRGAISQAKRSSARQQSVEDRAKPPSGSHVVQLPRLPTSIDEAIQMNPALKADLGCRDKQATYNMDHTLHMISAVRDCVGGRVHSTGSVQVLLHFKNDPATQKAVGVDVTPENSTLSRSDDKIVLACIQKAQKGSHIRTSDKYGAGTQFHSGFRIDFPIKDSYIFKMVRHGSYTYGTSFGCEVP